MRTDDVAQEGLARGRRASVVPITMSMMLPPGGPGTPPGGGKLGFNTFAMWGLCFVVVGVCYFLEQKELGSAKPASSIPSDVQRVLPSGAWLMSDGSIKKPPAPQAQ